MGSGVAGVAHGVPAHLAKVRREIPYASSGPWGLHSPNERSKVLVEGGGEYRRRRKLPREHSGVELSDHREVGRKHPEENQRERRSRDVEVGN